MEIVAKIFGVVFLLAAGTAVWFWPTARQRWTTIVATGVGLALLCFTFQASFGWTTWMGGVWWSWLIILAGIGAAVYGLLRSAGEDIRLTAGGWLVALMIWMLQGNLLLVLGPAVVYPLDGGAGGNRFLGIGQDGITLEVIRRLVYTRPAIGPEESDSAQIGVRGFRGVIIGVDSQIPINSKRLPSWAREAFNNATHCGLLHGAENSWLDRIIQLDYSPDPANYGIETPPVDP